MKKSWKLSCVELGKGRAYWLFSDTLKAKTWDKGYSDELKSYEGRQQRISDFWFEDKISDTLDFYDEVDIIKFWEVPFHRDNLWYNDSFFIVIPYHNFFIQIKGEKEILVKKGRVYVFNQRRLHRAHNNGKPFVCAVASASQTSVRRYLKKYNIAL